MEIRIRTLTPIWTGDIGGKCTRLRETSIIGSLRWWFEAIVRGLGGYACDSVGEVVKKCELKVEEYKKGVKPEELICPVCYVFGTTGWGRRFRLEIDGKLYQLPFVVVKANYLKSHRGWFLGTKEGGGGLIGTSVVRVSGNNILKEFLTLLLKTSCSWGLGAKTQDGFGICKFDGQCDVNGTIEKIKELLNKPGHDQDDKLFPSMDDYFFVKVMIDGDIDGSIQKVLGNRLFKDPKGQNQMNVEEFLQHLPMGHESRFYPTAPLIRYWLRSLFRNNDDLRHFLFGFVGKNVHKSCGGEISKGRCRKCGVKNIAKYEIEKKPKLILDNREYEKMGSKIFVSHIYNDGNNWEFKIWGYVPKVLPSNENREKVLQKLFSEIIKNKNFAEILKLDKDSVKANWCETSTERSNISSVEELISTILR